jgi:quercetin dioxygenase-like cupin family protein
MPLNPTRRRVRLLSLLVAVVGIAAAGILLYGGKSAAATSKHGATASAARTPRSSANASVASTPTAKRIDLAVGLPSRAPGYQLSLTRAIVPAGAAFPPHRHPGWQVAYIETGTLRFTVYRGQVKIFRGEPGTSRKLVRILRAGQTGSIKTGQWLVETPSLWHRGANVGRKRVVILLATLLRKGQPPAIPVKP